MPAYANFDEQAKKRHREAARIRPLLKSCLRAREKTCAAFFAGGGEAVFGRFDRATADADWLIGQLNLELRHLLEAGRPPSAGRRDAPQEIPF